MTNGGTHVCFTENCSQTGNYKKSRSTSTTNKRGQREEANGLYKIKQEIEKIQNRLTDSNRIKIPQPLALTIRLPKPYFRNIVLVDMP